MFNNSFEPKPAWNWTVVTAGNSNTCCPEVRVGFCREAQHRSAHSRCQQACHATARHISNMSTHVRSARPRKTHRIWPSEDENCKKTFMSELHCHVILPDDSHRSLFSPFCVMASSVAFAAILICPKMGSTNCHSRYCSQYQVLAHYNSRWPCKCFPSARTTASHSTNMLFIACRHFMKLHEPTGSNYRQLSDKIMSQYYTVYFFWAT
jgi:hypothetical protein